MHPLAPKAIAVAALATIGLASAADTGGPVAPPDYVGELWAMVKVSGPIGFALVCWLYRERRREWDKERSELRAEIGKLNDGREANQERTLTTLQQSRETSERTTNALLELTNLTRVMFDWLKDRTHRQPN